MRRVIGVMLMVDGVLAVLGFANVVSSLGTRDPESVAAIVCRLGAGGAAMIGGWLVTQRRAPGDQLAVVAVVWTAVMVTVGTIWRLLPTNLPPDIQEYVVLGYWLAAVVVVAFTWRARVISS